MSASPLTAGLSAPRIARLTAILQSLSSWLDDEDTLFSIEDYETPMSESLNRYLDLAYRGDEFHWKADLQEAEGHFHNLGWNSEAEHIANSRQLLVQLDRGIALFGGTERLQHETRRRLVESARGLINLRCYVRSRLGQLSNVTSSSNDGNQRLECTHSDDFASVNWYGTPFTFTPNQSKCVRILWDHWKRDKLSVRGDTIRDAADIAATRMDSVFRITENGKRRMHPAWLVMIGPGDVDGTYRLIDPPMRIK